MNISLVLALSMAQLPLAVSMQCIVLTYFLFDLYSGWVHYCLDYEGFNSIPFFGDLCHTFQHHHKDTTFIWRVNIWTSLSEVGLFLHVSDTLPLAILAWRGAYWTKQLSWANMLLIPMYWFKAAVFGRDISRF